jgi:hypothetical protein
MGQPGPAGRGGDRAASWRGWVPGGLGLQLLFPTPHRSLLDIDFDGDGDRDLLLYEYWLPLLLENTGVGFVDVTADRLPAVLPVASLASAGDVDGDGDGDEDLLLSTASQSALLRNEGGVFVSVPGVGPRGVLVDEDHDGRADLLTGARVSSNLHTRLHARLRAQFGPDWRIDVETWRAGAAARVAAIAVGTLEFPVVLAGVGMFHVSPPFVALLAVPLGPGEVRCALPIPPDPALVGGLLLAQGVVWDESRIVTTNVVRELLH